MNINNTFQNAILTLINKAISIAPFDKTRTGLVQEKNESGTYKVLVDGIVYPNVPILSGLSANIGDIVKVKYPSNNTSQMYIESGSLEQVINDIILRRDMEKYGVGKIILSTENINPATYLGFGTWIRWGNGRVPVGVDENDANFDSVEESGGGKTHTHTTGDHTLNANESGLPAHNHTATIEIESGKTASGTTYARVSTSGTATSGIIAVANATAKSATSAHNHGNTGSASNLQPYITCYMWKRIE